MCIIACMYAAYYNTQSILRSDWSSVLYRSAFWKKTYQLICIIYIHIPKVYKLFLLDLLRSPSRNVFSISFYSKIYS
nr:MAG TPA: hypothetical protein [Caudoviricetes sp.]